MRELLESRVVGFLLRRLGTVFVERFSAGESVEGKAQILDLARRGESLVIFPEGGFQRAVGLRPFRMGAFEVAAEARVPVLPVALKGTRALLHGDELFPHRGAVEVVVTPAVRTEGTDWAAALRLRDAARAQILEHCGEPELVER
jgi:1-acyl-sn-glycerol-3-phosphate acyltransferase